MVIIVLIAVILPTCMLFEFITYCKRRSIQERINEHYLLGKLATFILATLVSFHFNIYKNRVKLATFKISYLN